MISPRIIAHTVIRNEECWVWYALQSAIPYVENILVWDTGSTDSTVKIISSIDSPSLNFKQVSITSDETTLSQVRQHMLQETKADWLMILDGDEIWPDKSLKQVYDFIKKYGHKYDSIVVPTLNCVGDIYHVSPDWAGKYQIAGKTGHFNIRFINLNRVKDLHVSNLPGQLQSYVDDAGNSIQDRDPRSIAFIDAPYFHLTHLDRSQNRENETNVFWRSSKKKYMLGGPLPKDYLYPKVFYYPVPELVVSPWKNRSFLFIFKSALLALPRYFKHLLNG